MSRLARDGTAEPVSRDQILRHARGQGDILSPVQLTTSRIGNLTRLIHTLLYVMTIHTYIHTGHTTEMHDDPQSYESSLLTEWLSTLVRDDFFFSSIPYSTLTTINTSAILLFKSRVLCN